MDRSIGVSGAKERWQLSLRPNTEAEDVRAHFFEAVLEGRHPDTIGSDLVDKIERTQRGGLGSRPRDGEPEKLVTEATLQGDDPLDGDSPLEIAAASQQTSRGGDAFSGAELEIDSAALLEQAGLTSREKEAWRLRHEDDLTQEQVAERMAISQQRVNQLLQAAQKKLQGTTF